VDFALTDEQQLLRDTARSLVGSECSTTLVRAHLDDPSAADPLWRHLVEWLPLANGPLADLCLFLEECGRVLLPGPFFATTALYAPLLDAAGIPAEGTESGTVAVAGRSGEWSAAPARGPVRTFVLEADRVDRIAAVVAGPGVVVLGRDELLACREVATIDGSRRVFEIELPAPALEPGAAIEVDHAALDAWLERATVALSAELLGTAGWLLDVSVQYAKDRVQFDRPIGSFQAIQHKLADMALACEEAWSAVYYAAMCIDADDPDRHRAAHVAKAAAGEAATRAAKDGIQTHGGIGYTWEHDLHLYLRRAFASEHLMGTTAWHQDRLADLLLG
jgi:alkylation response protein AidB-like acyl-CoA dehydrogenase